MNERIRVLFLAANPEDVSQLRLNEEAREITERIHSAQIATRSTLLLPCP